MQAESTTERRSARRQKVFLGGKITTDLHFEPFECVIRDLGADGARIVLAANEKLPDHFRLAIPAKQCVMRVRTIWRDATTLGVYFDGFEFGALATGGTSPAPPASRSRH